MVNDITNFSFSPYVSDGFYDGLLLILLLSWAVFILISFAISVFIGKLLVKKNFPNYKLQKHLTRKFFAVLLLIAVYYVLGDIISAILKIHFPYGGGLVNLPFFVTSSIIGSYVYYQLYKRDKSS